MEPIRITVSCVGISETLGEALQTWRMTADEESEWVPVLIPDGPDGSIKTAWTGVRPESPSEAVSLLVHQTILDVREIMLYYADGTWASYVWESHGQSMDGKRRGHWRGRAKKKHCAHCIVTIELSDSQHNPVAAFIRMLGEVERVLYCE